MNNKCGKKIFMLVFAGCCIIFAASAKPRKDTFTSFEGATTEWRAVQTMWSDGDVSTGAVLSTDWASDGKQSLKCMYAAPASGKGGSTYFTEKMAMKDISPYDAISYDVYNPSAQTVQAALALTTGSGWTWFESKPVDIKPGEKKTIVVELYEGQLKAASSQWAFKLDLENPDDLRRVAVKFFVPSEAGKGTIYIDNMTLIVE